MLSVYNRTQKMKEEARKKLAKYHELRKQRGMSLLEVIIVLGIIGTIAAGVVVLAQRAFDSRAVTELVTNTNTVRVAMKDAYQKSGSYPAYQSPLELTGDTIKSTTDAIPAAQLVQLGKITLMKCVIIFLEILSVLEEPSLLTAQKYLKVLLWN